MPRGAQNLIQERRATRASARNKDAENTPAAASLELFEPVHKQTDVERPIVGIGRSTAYGGRDLRPPPGIKINWKSKDLSREVDKIVAESKARVPATYAAKGAKSKASRDGKGTKSADDLEVESVVDKNHEDQAGKKTMTGKSAARSSKVESAKSSDGSSRSSHTSESELGLAEITAASFAQAGPTPTSQPRQPARQPPAAQAPRSGGNIWNTVSPRNWNWWMVIRYLATGIFLYWWINRTVMHSTGALGNYGFPMWNPNASLPAPNLDPLKYQLNVVERRINELATYRRPKDAPRRINFFAPGLGTMVDDYLTSPTRRLYFGPGTAVRMIRAPAKLIFSPVTMLKKYLGPPPPPLVGRTASTVFQKWDDLGECWCSPDSGGQSQIAVDLALHVIPHELVVEHISAAATIEAMAMPRDMEVWVPIDDEQVRDRVERDFNATHWRSELERARDDGSDGGGASGRDDLNGARRALDASWVRIGRFQFDLQGGEQQAFRLPIDLANYHMPVRKVVVRTTSTWGNSGSVCLYRLKLYGLVAVEEADEAGDDATEAEAAEPQPPQPQQGGITRVQWNE